MKVQTEIRKRVLGTWYEPGILYEVPEAVGVKLIEEGFTSDTSWPAPVFVDEDELNVIMYSRSREELNNLAQNEGVSNPEKLQTKRDVALEISKRRK